MKRRTLLGLGLLLAARAASALDQCWWKTPGYSWCGRCGCTWNKVEGHTTWYRRRPYGEADGCFPLCETCWCELRTPQARMPYYRRHWERSRADDPKTPWSMIEAAVLAEGEGCGAAADAGTGVG